MPEHPRILRYLTIADGTILLEPASKQALDPMLELETMSKEILWNLLITVQYLYCKTVWNGGLHKDGMGDDSFQLDTCSNSLPHALAKLSMT
ncbi:hypothetical protein Tco_0405002 [Tanacetum coccineum]